MPVLAPHLLGQVGFGELTSSLATAPLAAVCALLVLVVGFLWVENRNLHAAAAAKSKEHQDELTKRDAECDRQVETLRAETLATVKEHAKASEDQLRTIIPLAQRLGDAVLSLERVTDRITGGTR